ncbi:hypothetical protein [Solimonas sp. SE-A11]|uniref:hypothetical protein n=1 Tax=Solimonas sp. SE-A11 TaxID=3054954 RepID=UPI00259CFF9C|nr:hypothetical protein [Solimonas sp. SE-A11]MDM4771175.1 hypothetical protein [Solimonas sp. SE-A11]
MFLIVTNKRDITSDFIVLELQKRSLPFFRLNTEDISRGSLRCRPAEGHWSYTLDGKGFDLSAVRAGYFRRPGMPEPLAGFDEDDQAYCVGAQRKLTQGAQRKVTHL